MNFNIGVENISLVVLAINPLEGSPKDNVVSGTVRVYKRVTGSEVDVLASTALTQEGATSKWYYDWSPTILSSGQYFIEYILIDDDANTATLTEDLIIDKRINFQFSAADNTTTIELAIWAEVPGKVLTDIDSIDAQILNASGVMIDDLGTQTLHSSEGVFRFTTTSGALGNNTPYYLAIQAIRGNDTFNVNMGLATGI